jgi:magnesium transporter
MRNIRSEHEQNNMANNQDMSERKDDPSRIASLYGLTPKVETAINHAVMNGEKRRARILMALLHPADQADLIERLPMDVAA